MNQFALGRPWIMFFWASDTTTLAAATPSTPVDPHKTTRGYSGRSNPQRSIIGITPASSAAPYTLGLISRRTCAAGG